ncbi:hypothetical protein JOQ06_023152 [Pogonophryne albipinna]|uniref:Testicular haploid expressed protein n=1 Tax=Pogonophryne albipinna TaxID=1090488 RepID=A0AAD6FTL1_9TELE|nr:hypothetical protein JOQ06_023152 [Pogonophryne albipinna]
MILHICEKVIWGNQDPIWPLSASGAAPSARIQYLSRHKRDFSAREDPRRPPHTPHCERSCPIWHVDPRLKTSAVITPRLLQLSIPKLIRPDFHSNRESVASIVSFASKTAQIPPRLIRLSLPRLKQSNICLQIGPPADSIWTVSKAARKATASDRVEMLATPKQLSKNYVPPRDPEWSRNTVLSS